MNSVQWFFILETILIVPIPPEFKPRNSFTISLPNHFMNKFLRQCSRSDHWFGSIILEVKAPAMRRDMCSGIGTLFWKKKDVSIPILFLVWGKLMVNVPNGWVGAAENMSWSHGSSRYHTLIHQIRIGIGTIGNVEKTLWAYFRRWWHECCGKIACWWWNYSNALRMVPKEESWAGGDLTFLAYLYRHLANSLYIVGAGFH